MTIVGVGFDPPSDTAPWAEEEGFEFDLWTDDDKTLAETYDAGTGAFPSRVTMILDADGVLVLEYRDNVDFGTHPQEVLEDCQLLFGG